MAPNAPKFSVPIPIPGVPIPIPGGPSVHVPGTGGSGGIHVPNPLHVVSDAGHFFGALLDPHTWVRIGEVLVGTILLVVGFDHMFDTNMTGKLAKVAPYMMV